MKAAVYARYGSPEVLELRDVPDPRPKAHEILIKTHATTVTTGDWRMRSLQLPAGFGFLGRLAVGITGPRQPILGTELSGEVVEIGKAVTKFRVGDSVFAFPGSRMGCHAEYRCMAEDGPVARRPASIGHEQAAALSFGGTTALGFLRRGGVKAGERVLVHGASGSVGSAAVQLAKHFGAHVTGVCSTGNVKLVRSIGADEVIDYTKEDFTKRGQTWDVIVDTNGKAGFGRSRGCLGVEGRMLVIAGGLPDMLRAPWVALTSRQRIIAGPASVKAEDLQLLAELAEAGVVTPVIGRSYPFERIADAHRYVDSGHKRGSAVVTMAA
jgi:NADPH:quinone reductase-like Zn-dependent oxidoreductase